MKHKTDRLKFFDKHTTLGVILIFLWTTIFIQLIGATAAEKITGFKSDIRVDVNSFGDLEKLFSEIGSAVPPWPYFLIVSAFGLLALLIHKWWFRPDFRGCIRLENTGKGLVMQWPLLLYILLAPVLIRIFGGEFDFGQINLNNIGISLCAGITEEVTYRAMPLSYLMRQKPDEKKIPLYALLSSLVFGLAHLSNLLAGAATGLLLLQIVGAFAMGFLFAAVYLRTGNILPTMIVHFINDVVSCCVVSQVSNGILKGSLDLTNIPDVVAIIVYITIALYLIRPARRQDILRIFDERWNRN